MISLPRLTKKEHLGTWLVRCYIVPMQLTYNGSIPLVRFPVVKLQAHFHVKNTQPPHHSHLGLEFTKCTPNHLLRPTDTNLHRFENANCFLQFGLQSTLNSFISTKNGNVLKFSAEWRNLKSPRSWWSVNGEDRALWNCWHLQDFSTCNYIHGLSFIWGPFKWQWKAKPERKKYDFKFMQISVDRALMVFISDIHDQIFSWPVSKRLSSVKIRIDIMAISQSL